MTFEDYQRDLYLDVLSAIRRIEPDLGDLRWKLERVEDSFVPYPGLPKFDVVELKKKRLNPI